MCSTALRLLGFVALLLGSVASVRAADAPASNDLQRCTKPSPPAEREAACTAFLAKPGSSAKDTALAYYFRGFGRTDYRRDDLAELDLSVAIGFDAELWPARWARAELKSRHRNYADAAADWTDVLRRQPQIASLYAKRAAALDNAGRSDEATADYTKAIAMAGPNDPLPQFYLDRGGAEEGAHQWPKALADYGEAIQRSGDLREAYFARGRVRFLTGEFSAAIVDLTKAADADAANGYPALWLYMAELRSGKSNKDAAAGLRVRGERLNVKTWPGPIIEAMLGDRRPEQVPAPTEPVAWTEAVRKAAGQCELSFYLGEAGLAKGDREHAVTLFRASVDSGIKEFVEYRAATFELQRVAP